MVLPFEGNLKPFSDNHSIREVVISIFLANRILKPERFQSLITNGLKNDFQSYENINSFEIQINPLQPTGQLSQTNDLGIIGFKLIGFEEGKIKHILQGTNEKNRTFVAYHTFTYTNWDAFLRNHLSFLEEISNEHSEMYVTAVSLHYIDEFTWISEEAINLSDVFNNDSDLLPRNFFLSSQLSNSVFTTETKEGNAFYFDRLELNVENKQQKKIIISHNVTKQFQDITLLSELLLPSFNVLRISLNELHLNNKRILHKLLTQAVKKLINLPKESL